MIIRQTVNYLVHLIAGILLGSLLIGAGAGCAKRWRKARRDSAIGEDLPGGP